MFRPSIHAALNTARRSVLKNTTSAFNTSRTSNTGFTKRFFNSSARTFQQQAGAQAQKKSGKLQELMRTYGVSALGVYLALSCIDLPICFYFVHQLGELKIKLYINKAKAFVGLSDKTDEDVAKEVALNQQQRLEAQEQEAKEESGFSWGKYWEHLKNSTLLTEFLIAYGIHKSLVFIRLPITAAITPGCVRVLQRMGFKINTKVQMPHTLQQNLKTPTGLQNNYSLKANQAASESSKKWFGLF